MIVFLLGGGLQALAIGASLSRHSDYRLIVVSDDLDVRGSSFFDVVINKRVESVDQLAQLISQIKPDVVIPTSDTYTLLLSSAKELLTSTFGVRCACSNSASVNLVCDKQAFMSFCQTNSIPHPRTIPIDSKTFMPDSLFSPFPAIIKPNHSVGSRGITMVNSDAEIKGVLPHLEQEYGSCTLQEYIDNPDFYYNVMLYRYCDGSFSEAVVVKIVRHYPIGAGSSCCCVTETNKKLVSICKDTLSRLCWDGFADFDVLYDKRDSEYKIIEINPRVPACLRIALEAGVNFPEIIIDDLLNKERREVEPKEDIVLRYLGTDILWFLSSIGKRKIPASWFKFLGKKIYYQDIYLKDPSSWYRWLLSGIKKFLAGFAFRKQVKKSA